MENFFGRNLDLVDRYEIFASQMTYGYLPNVVNTPEVTYINCDYTRIYLLSNTTCVISAAESAYPSGAHELTLVLKVRVTPALVFSVVLGVLCLSFVSFCWSWSCLSSELTNSVGPLVSTNTFHKIGDLNNRIQLKSFPMQIRSKFGATLLAKINICGHLSANLDIPVNDTI